MWVGLLALVVFAAAYYTSLHRPGVQSHDGYFNWADQHSLREEARALSRGDLPGTAANSDYAFGLGYPLLAVPALWVGIDQDPFVIVNALIFASELMIVVVLGTRLRSRAFGFGVAALLAFATPLVAFTLVPWSTSITTLSILLALLVATDPFDRRLGHVLVLGAAIGLCFASRYVDALWPALIGLSALVRRPHGWRSALIVGGVAMVFVLPVLWSHEIVFGDPIKTPYAHHEREGDVDQSLDAFNPVRAPLSFFEVFVTGVHDGKRVPAEPMLEAAPWLIAAPLGLWFVVRRRVPAWRVYAIASAISVAASTFYLSFWAGTGHDLQFHNLRYFISWIPPWALLAAYGTVVLATRARALAPASFRAQPRLWARVAPGPTTVRGSVQLLDTTPDRQGETEREQPEPDHHRQQRVAG